MRKDTNIKALMKSLQSNILLVAAAELLIYNGGLQIKYEVQHHFGLFSSLVGREFEIYFNSSFWIIIPIIITLIFMRLNCPEALSVFTPGSFGRKMKSLGRGLLIGMVVMVFLALPLTQFHSIFYESEIEEHHRIECVHYDNSACVHSDLNAL